MPDVRQIVGNRISSKQGRTCRVNLTDPTLPGSLVIAVGVGVHAGTGSWPLTIDGTGWTKLPTYIADEMSVAVWYRAASPTLTSVAITSAGGRSVQAAVIEVPGSAQTSVLDRVAVGRGQSQLPRSGSTGTTAQADMTIIGILANRYSSTLQFGHSGGLTKLTEGATPNADPDDWRSRLTIHSASSVAARSWSLSSLLAARRDYVSVVLAFKGGSAGPLRITSMNQPPMLETGGRGDLSQFGPLVSKEQPPILTTGGSGWIGPFALQWRLGGRDGLLIGEGTDYRVERVEGIGGFEMRTSDGDSARTDGAQRGIDLQSPRTLLFRVNFDGPPAGLEAAMQRLLAKVRPQRDRDEELYFRLPGRPLQMLWYRPVQLLRNVDAAQLLRADQAFALKAVDPRIYSARERQVQVPVTPAGAELVTAVSAINSGNARAYPVIRIVGAPGVEVTRVQLVNVTADVAFEVATTIPPGGQLVGDMPARVTNAPRSVVALDGQGGMYGAWQPPRQPFYLAPDPVAPNGVNGLYLRTEPPGAPVTATLTYRDTSSG